MIRRDFVRATGLATGSLFFASLNRASDVLGMPPEDNYIQIATDPGFTNIILEVSGYLGLAEISSLLAIGQTYYWRQTRLVRGLQQVVYHGHLLESQAAELTHVYNIELIPFIQEVNDEEGPPPKSYIICHIPPGNPAQAVTREIPASDLQEHLGHGDHEGVCVEEDFGDGSAGQSGDHGKPDDPGGHRQGRGKTEDMPTEFKLGQNYPNPFSTVTTLPLSLPQDSHVHISVHNLLGQQLEVFVDSDLPAGRHEFIWNGAQFTSGTYLITVDAGLYRQTRRIALTK